MQAVDRVDNPGTRDINVDAEADADGVDKAKTAAKP